MAKCITLISILVFLNLAVKAQGEIGAQLVRMDLSNANGGTVSQIFDEVNYIPLETTKESLISKIDKILVTDNYYIILDGWGNQILLFNKKGEFHSKIDKIQGVEKQATINSLFKSFTVDREKKEIIVCTSSMLSGGRDKIFYFDFDGKLIKSIKTEAPIDYDFCSIGNDKLLFRNRIPWSVEEAQENTLHANLLAFSNGSILYKKLLPFSPSFYISDRKGRWSTGEQLSESGNHVRQFYFTSFYDYSIYQLDSTEIKHKYSFIFPLSSSLPKDFISNNAYTSDLFTKQNPSYIYGIGNVYGLKDWLTFCAGSSEEKKEYSFLYNKVTGELLSYYRIQPDAANYFLPLGFNTAYPIKGCDDEYFYSTVSFSNMLSSRNENRDKNLNYNSALKNYFELNPKQANPILIQVRPKQKL